MDDTARAAVVRELDSLEEWCSRHAAKLPGWNTPTPATHAVWDVIDEIRRRVNALEATGD